MNDKLAVNFRRCFETEGTNPNPFPAIQADFLPRSSYARAGQLFRPDGFLRRHDYAVDVLGGAKGAHYIGDYRDHGGILTPHRRRIYPLGADNR